MKMLTQIISAAMICSLPTHWTTQYWRTGNYRRIAALNAAFLCVKQSHTLSIMSGLDEHTKVWPAPIGWYANLFKSGSIIGVMQSVYPFTIGFTAMNISPVQTSGQTHPSTKLDSRFEIFQHGKLIAEDVDGTRALRLKRRYPALIVKFAGMIGGVK
ncbi:hypothetical protein [Crenothrix sp.]|uniref:hypothetical protein n=1 Tax=Crenothrix sp. TaxID=3100433 RepID=UPI00374CDA9C